MADRTGLEPATSGVTGRHSNQLNYRSLEWWVMRDLNPRHSPCKGDALPAELITRWYRAGDFITVTANITVKIHFNLVKISSFYSQIQNTESFLTLSSDAAG